MILQLPGEGMDHEQIYNQILNRLRRCLKKTEAEVLIENKSNARSEDPSYSDNEMEVDGADDTTDVENGNSNPPQSNGIDSPKASKHLFTMDFVNSGCNNSLNKLKPGEKSISLPGMTIDLLKM